MSAPKGNKFAVGNSGREKMFKSPEDLQKAIDEYIYKCDNHKVSVYSKVLGDVVNVPDPIPYTIEGLCLVLQCDRATLLNYQRAEGYEDYFNTIKNAKLKIQENKVVRALKGESPSTYAIFDMINNTDYKNTNTTELTGANGKDLGAKIDLNFNGQLLDLRGK